MTTITLTMQIEQAQALTNLIDLATRIHMCQFREIPHLARQGEIKHRDGRMLTTSEISDVEAAMDLTSMACGFFSSASFGIGSRIVNKDAHRGWEIKKVLDKALAMHRDPNPDFMNVHYDGLIVRYTNDPAPTATVSENTSGQ